MSVDLTVPPVGRVGVKGVNLFAITPGQPGVVSGSAGDFSTSWSPRAWPSEAEPVSLDPHPQWQPVRADSQLTRASAGLLQAAGTGDEALRSFMARLFQPLSDANQYPAPMAF
jgi:hypothetical protein